MEYEKPRIVNVADAARAIQGLKSSAPIRDNIDPLSPRTRSAPMRRTSSRQPGRLLARPSDWRAFATNSTW